MTAMSPSPSKRSEELSKVVDKVLTQILGTEATQIIYDYLENNHRIKKCEIAKKLDSFNHALEVYLGSGAVVIKRIIEENIEIGGLENKGVDFSEPHKISKLE